MTVEQILDKMASPSREDDLNHLTELFYAKVKPMPEPQRQRYEARYRNLALQRIARTWESLREIQKRAERFSPED